MKRANASVGSPIRRTGPFVPGAGRIPPYLAGRESEQEVIGHQLETLASGQPPEGDLILYGPRGNGKTALLEWTRREARSKGLTSLDFSSAEIESKEWLARELSVLPPWTRVLGEFSAFGLRVKASDKPSGRISRALGAKARKRPLIVAVDEAHSLDAVAGRALMHAVQLVRRRDLPIMLVVAGTPDLPRRLNEMESSFWERSEVLRIGLLDRKAAKDAIRMPFRMYGRSIDAGALDEAATASHGYPYFLQLWGRLLWRADPDRARTVSIDDAIRARADFEDTRNRYYGSRYDELFRVQLNFVAAKLALAFIDASHRTLQEIQTIVTEALAMEGRGTEPEAVRDAIDRLRDLGFIWAETSRGGQHFVPGIPSLMGFVARSEGFKS